MLIEWFNSI